MAQIERKRIEEQMAKMTRHIAEDRRNLESTNFEIRRGAEVFLRHHEEQYELLRVYLEYLGQKEAVKS